MTPPGVDLWPIHATGPGMDWTPVATLTLLLLCYEPRNLQDVPHMPPEERVCSVVDLLLVRP